jgi:hypothetical protein
MSIINNWNDVNTLKNGDKISCKNKQYTIDSKDVDQDYSGTRIILTLNKDKELIINHLGDISGDFGDFNLSDNKLVKISNGGKRKTRRHRKRRTKKTRRRYK